MKKINEHTIDRISRELLENHSEEAPANAFYAIKSELNVYSREKRKRFYLYIAASWLVLFSFGLGYFTRSFNISDSGIIAENKHQEILGSKITVTASNNIALTSNVKTSKTVKTISRSNNSLKGSFKNNSSQTANTTEQNSDIFIQNVANDITKSSNLDSNSIVISHNDSLKLMYTFISLSKGLTQDSASNDNVALAYQNPIFPIETQSRNHWVITGGVTPMMGFDMLGTENSSANQSRLKSNITDNQNLATNKDVSVSYSTGISVKRSVSEKWNMRSGMSFNKITESNTEMSYVEVPVMCEYRLIDQTLKLYFTNGFGAGFKETDVYPIGMSGFSFLYPLNKKVDINLEPMYKHVFGKTWNYKADYYGMMAGFSVKF